MLLPELLYMYLFLYLRLMPQPQMEEMLNEQFNLLIY